MEEQFLTSGVVAKLLNVTETSLRKWHKNGKFTAHHVNPNTGYKYYTEEQVRQFLENRQQKTETKAIVPVKTKEVTKETSSKTVQSKPKKRKSQEIKSKSKEFDLEKPLFKLYVDEGSGKTWVNYYAMRSGKTNALAFINNIKLFKRLTQFIDGTEIQTDDNKLQFDESMHNVNIAIGNEDLDNINGFKPHLLINLVIIIQQMKKLKKRDL